MANFKTHITVAAFGSIAATAVCIQKIGISDEHAVILFLLGCIAGMLPDIDSNHSIPAKWFFRSLTATSMVAMAFYSIPKFSTLVVLGCLLSTFIFVHYIFSYTMKSITSHRGLFHSVPAAGLFGMAMYFTGYHGFTWSAHFSWLAASFISGGYVLHLILDECYSVDLMGGRLKKSFGSALTIFNKRQWRGYIMLYLIFACASLYAYDPNIILLSHTS
ncbi:MAG: metal-dependent hydrolase [Mariprofundaceae bacterium]|nr:metal-dependent hydrolase [Mariprofundaceae bacterium]